MTSLRKVRVLLAFVVVVWVMLIGESRATAAQEKGTVKSEGTSTPWENFLQSEGVPVYRGFAISDVSKVKLGPWKRYGIDGAFVYLDGAGGITTGFIFEIQPGQKSLPVRHIFEGRVVVLGGSGEAHFWQEGGKKVTALFQKGTLFPLPLNAWYEILNTGKEPVRMYGVSSEPLFIDLFRDVSFVFNSNHAFTGRFDGSLDFFKPEPVELKPNLRDKLGYAVSVTNLVPDVNTAKLYPAGHGVLETAWREAGGSGTTNRHYSMAFDNLDSHVEVFLPAVYEMAHKHGPGANVMYLYGHGYSLLWPPELGKDPYKDGHGDKVMRVDWGPYTVFVPPLNWYHQHFNPSPEPARFIKVAAFGSRVHQLTARVFGEYPDAIDYPDEDPQIKLDFEAECAKRGVKSLMPPVEKFLKLREAEQKEKEGKK